MFLGPAWWALVPLASAVAALGRARLLPPLGFKLWHVPFALPGELFLRDGGSWLISLWVSIQMPRRPPMQESRPILPQCPVYPHLS